MKGVIRNNKFIIFINSLLFNIFFIIWTLLWGGGMLPLAIFSRKMAYVTGYYWSVVILKSLRLICGVSCEISGVENIPDDSCVVAAKHESTWDTVFLLTLLRNPVFILKKSLVYIPVYGTQLLCMRMIYINRARSKEAMRNIIKQSHKVIKEKRKIIIFPQGTRTAPNKKMPYKSGIYALCRENNLPALPISLNSGRLWGKNSFIKKPGVIKVAILPQLEVNNDDKKSFMFKLEESIENSYKKL